MYHCPAGMLYPAGLTIRTDHELDSAQQPSLPAGTASGVCQQEPELQHRSCWMFGSWYCIQYHYTTP